MLGMKVNDLPCSSGGYWAPQEESGWSKGESLIFAALLELESGLLPKKTNPKTTTRPIARWQDAGTRNRRVGLRELPAPVES